MKVKNSIPTVERHELSNWIIPINLILKIVTENEVVQENKVFEGNKTRIENCKTKEINKLKILINPMLWINEQSKQSR